MRYFRASVRETVKTYPLLAGMGITAGEGMPQKMDSQSEGSLAVGDLRRRRARCVEGPARTASSA